MSDRWVLSLFSYCFTLNTRWPFWDETISASDTLLMRNIPFILGTWGLVEQTLFADAFGFLLLPLPWEDSKFVSLVFVFHVYVTTMDRAILRRPDGGRFHLVPPSQPSSQFNVLILETQWCTKFSNQRKDLSNTDWLTETVWHLQIFAMQSNISLDVSWSLHYKAELHGGGSRQPSKYYHLRWAGLKIPILLYFIEDWNPIKRLNEHVVFC